MDIFYQPENARAFNTAYNHWEEATNEERCVLAAFMFKYTNHLQTMYLMWNSGTLDEEVYFSEETAFLSMINGDGGTAWWTFVKGQYSESFMQRIEGRLTSESIPSFASELPWFSSWRDV